MKKLNIIAGWLATRIPILVPLLTLGFGWGGKQISRWYQRNGIFRFKPDDEIELKANFFGYGLRPRGVIVDCKKDGDYIVNMISDDDGNWHRLVKEGWIPPNVTRSVRRQHHSKWNIEHHFCLCKK